ncbi:MAG: YihY/virulence factor BrkB family protein [Alphaproteobacteria bacterium HGW-Alphaproteobacteria-4]|nr:MAG: YihY/virulence factor BrkB family protein [Alphaproteobacteria bacterium HGW-Alphaproteobacteria-4]
MRRVWNFIIGMAKRIGQTQMGLIAAGVAFYAMFAVFPAMTATIALWSLVADPAAISSYMLVAEEFVPHEAWGILSDQVAALLAGPKATVGGASLLSLLIALYSARAGVAALVQGLNSIHGTAQHPTLWGYLLGYVLTMALIATILLALATVVVVPVALAFLPPSPLRGWLLSELPWGATFVLVLSALAMLYHFGPSAAGRRTRRVIPGAMLAALAWSGASLAFSFYLANFGTYNRIYGSLGAVIALMMWFYISAYAVLLGAALNAELSKHQ